MSTTAMDIIRKSQQHARLKLPEHLTVAVSARADQAEATLVRAMEAFGMPALSSMSVEERELVAIGVVLPAILGTALGHDPRDCQQAKARLGCLEYLLDRYDSAEVQR